MLTLVETLNSPQIFNWVVKCNHLLTIETQFLKISTRKRFILWRLILENMNHNLNTFLGEKTVTDAIYRFPLDRRLNSTQDSHYTTETLTAIYDTEKPSEITFPLNF